MEKLLLQPTYESEFAPQSAEFTDYAETIGVEKEKLLPNEKVTLSHEMLYSDTVVGPDNAMISGIISVSNEHMFILRLDPDKNIPREDRKFGTPYLLVDLEFMKDPYSQTSEHFKGLRMDQTVTLGRHHQQDRFTHRPEMSRNQCNITVTKEGVEINNLMPSNATQISGNILKEKEQKSDEKYTYAADYTQALLKRASEGDTGFGRSNAEHINGTYLNHPIIGRNSKQLENGVYLTRGSEALIADTNSQKTRGAIEGVIALTQYLGEDAPNEEILQIVESQVGKILKYNLDKTDSLSEPYRGNKGIGISSYIEKGVGVCRHQAILAGLTMEEMIGRGILNGTTGVERNLRYDAKKKTPAGGHAWAVFKPAGAQSELEDYIIDPANNYVGTRKEALEKGGWYYKTNSEK